MPLISILLEHIVYEDGIKFDVVKKKKFLDIKPHVHKNKIKMYPRHRAYYKKFMRKFYDINFPINHLLCHGFEFIWSVECNQFFELLKINLVESHILISPYQSKKFLLHVDALNVAIESILVQPGNKTINHPNIYAILKLNKVTTKLLNYINRGTCNDLFSTKVLEYLLMNLLMFYTDHQD